MKWPSWLAPKRALVPELKLPSWAEIDMRYRPQGAALQIRVDTARAYPEWFALLHAKEFPCEPPLTRMPDVTQPDQYWLEVAYQCTKLEVQASIAGTEFDPRTNKQPVVFKFSNTPKWALKNFPPGKTWQVATQGKEARGHYIRIRGNLPF